MADRRPRRSRAPVASSPSSSEPGPPASPHRRSPKAPSTPTRRSARTFTLLNANGSKVQFGPMTPLPIGGALVWIRPIIVTGTTSTTVLPPVRCARRFQRHRRARSTTSLAIDAAVARRPGPDRPASGDAPADVLFDDHVDVAVGAQPCPARSTGRGCTGGASRRGSGSPASACPARPACPHALLRACARNARSPTASASSMSRIGGATDVAMAKCSRARMPDEYVRSGRWIASPSWVNSTISSMCSSTSREVMPRARHPRRMLRQPGGARAAASRRRRAASARRRRGPRPSVSGSSPATAASIVDLPEPLEPMTPTASPSWTSNDTPRSAWTRLRPGAGAGDDPLADRRPPVLEDLVVDAQVAHPDRQGAGRSSRPPVAPFGPARKKEKPATSRTAETTTSCEHLRRGASGGRGTPTGRGRGCRPSG